ncbi:MAG: hypothetical protein JRI23_34745 [Deltaproteobacteria bacterium]|jgi:MYXO-CTERM domain-containing protein|nr:hypothetical protein [Deltaproteobacteria bacterium]MBW2537466.1 hypothetical protein [Deltaproteobacteria bacterium]
MNRRLAWATSGSAVLTVSALALAATFPADSDYNALTQNGQGIGDPLADGQNNGREIVGDENDPAMYIYSDGTDFFVRLRLDVDPRQAGSAANLRPYGWGILIDTDGDLADFEVSLLANGIPDEIELAINTTQSGLGDPSDTAETIVTIADHGATQDYPVPFVDVDPGKNIQVVDAGTTFNGDPDFFLDLSVPVADMVAAGVPVSGPLRVWGGSSSNGRSITVDLANSPDTPGEGSLGPSASDPVGLDGEPVATTDSDGDGLDDAFEIAIGSDPNDADSDDDGVIDGDELEPGSDGDGDGLINVLDPDSDDDGLFDGTELGLGCDAGGTDASLGHCVADADGGATTTDPLDADTDDGGVSDGSEDANLNGAVDADEGDPNDGADDGAVVDSDGDGLSDATEAFLGSDPNDADSDDDGVLDGQENNPSDDTDGDGLINVLDVDSDDDGLYDGTERGLDCDDPATDPGPPAHCRADADEGATTTSAVKADTDDGGVIDGSEDTNLDGAVDAGELDPNDGSDDGSVVDTDGDGLSDALEATLGTDPNDADSDNDGVVDGDEPNFSDDHDGDGDINALDPDSDDDGLFDGTELGLPCDNPDTDMAANHCIPDADQGATTTSPLDADTDDGGVNDGDEDVNHNGAIDPGESDPNDPSDDGSVVLCNDDSDCGDAFSGRICTDDGVCADGCRESGGNGCPSGEVCTDVVDGIGICVQGTEPPEEEAGLTDGIVASGGCGCRATGASTAASSWWWLVAAAALGLARRRRRE